MSKERNIRGWLIVMVSFMILMLVFATCISCMGVYVKPVSDEFGIPRTAFTLTTTIQALAMMISSFFAGKLLERYNMKLLITMGTLCCVACMFIFSIAPSIMWFYCAGVLMGISIAFTCNIPVAILIKNWFSEKQEGLALSIAFIGSGFGAMILNPLYTAIIESHGWRTSFVVAGVLMLVILVPSILIFVARDPDEAHKNKAIKEQKQKELPDESVTINENDFTMSEAMKMGRTWLVFFAYIVMPFSTMAILNHGIPFMTDYGMSPERAAAVISIGSGILIPGKILAGILYDKFGIKKVSILQLILITACITVFWLNGLINSTAMIVLYIILYGLGLPVATLSMPLVLPIMYGKSHFGSIMGMFSMASGIGGILQIVISMIYDAAGSYYPAWIMITILCILTVIIFATCVRPCRRRSD